AGEARRFHQNQHVQGIAIQTQRLGYEAVVSGIVNRRKQGAIQAKDVELLVVLVLVHRVSGNLNDSVDTVRSTVADGKFRVIKHLFHARTTWAAYPSDYDRRSLSGCPRCGNPVS